MLCRIKSKQQLQKDDNSNSDNNEQHDLSIQERLSNPSANLALAQTVRRRINSPEVNNYSPEGRPYTLHQLHQLFDPALTQVDPETQIIDQRLRQVDLLNMPQTRSDSARLVNFYERQELKTNWQYPTPLQVGLAGIRKQVMIRQLGR